MGTKNKQELYFQRFSLLKTYLMLCGRHRARLWDTKWHRGGFLQKERKNVVQRYWHEKNVIKRKEMECSAQERI